MLSDGVQPTKYPIRVWVLSHWQVDSKVEIFQTRSAEELPWAQICVSIFSAGLHLHASKTLALTTTAGPERVEAIKS